MSVARVVEISSTSPKSFDDAVAQGIERANQTLRNVRSAWVKEQKALVENGKVVAYRVSARNVGTRVARSTCVGATLPLMPENLRR